MTIVPPEQWLFALLGWSGSTYYLRNMRLYIEKNGIPSLTSKEIEEKMRKRTYQTAKKRRIDTGLESKKLVNARDKLEEDHRPISVKSQFLSSLAREEIQNCDNITLGMSHHQLYLRYGDKEVKRKNTSYNHPGRDYQETVLEAFHVASARDSEADLLLYLGFPYFPAEMRNAG